MTILFGIALILVFFFIFNSNINSNDKKQITTNVSNEAAITDSMILMLLDHVRQGEKERERFQEEWLMKWHIPSWEAKFLEQCGYSVDPSPIYHSYQNNSDTDTWEKMLIKSHKKSIEEGREEDEDLAWAEFYRFLDEYKNIVKREQYRLRSEQYGVKITEFVEHIRSDEDWPDDLSYWEDSKSKKIEAKLNEIKQRRRENNYFINRKENLQVILFYKEYHPYYNGQNHLFNDFSRLVLQLKQNNSSAVTYFADILHNYLGDNFTIVTIPSHDPTKSNTGINSVVHELIFRGSGRIDGTLCLKRRYLIDKLSLGGDRSINTQLSSMFVDNLELIIEKKVLLIDDVSSTENSLRAGRKLLLSAGAREVQAFSIAKTIT